MAGLRIAASARSRLRRGRPGGARPRSGGRRHAGGARGPGGGGRPAGGPAARPVRPALVPGRQRGLVESLPAAARGRLDPGLLAMADEGARVEPGGDPGRGHGARRARRRAASCSSASSTCWSTPAVATPGVRRRGRVSGPCAAAAWIDWAGFSYPFNLSQQPAISVPAASPRRACRSGCRSWRAKYQEALVLRAARAFEPPEPQPMPAEPRGQRRSGRGCLRFDSGSERMLGCCQLRPGYSMPRALGMDGSHGHANSIGGHHARRGVGTGARRRVSRRRRWSSARKPARRASTRSCSLRAPPSTPAPGRSTTG